jgi:hypothetical protein
MFEQLHLLTDYEFLTKYEFWTTLFAGATAAIAGFGLYGLWRYVKATMIIARATELQGDVLSRPSITVLCSASGQDLNPKLPFRYGHIDFMVSNNSKVHGKAKITFKARLVVASPHRVKEFPAPSPFDGIIVLCLAAEDKCDVPLYFDDLANTEIDSRDSLTIEGIVESSPWVGPEDFQPDPPITYLWQSADKKWKPILHQVAPAATARGRLAVSNTVVR